LSALLRDYCGVNYNDDKHGEENGERE
jgi:hypothetical protein